MAAYPGLGTIAMIWPARATVDCERLDDGLHLFSAVDPKGRRGKRHYCYLIPGAAGNVMLHPPDAPSFFEQCRALIDAAGGVRWIFLTHDGDDSAGRAIATDIWRAEVLAHEAELARLAITGRGFSQDHDLDARLSVIVLPGHTAGYSCLRRRAAGGGAQFFAGHLMIRGARGWSGAASAPLFMQSLASLRRLADLDLDALMPEHAWSDAKGNERAPLAFDAGVRQQAVQQAVDGLLRKARSR